MPASAIIRAAKAISRKHRLPHSRGFRWKVEKSKPARCRGLGIGPRSMAIAGEWRTLVARRMSTVGCGRRDDAHWTFTVPGAELDGVLFVSKRGTGHIGWVSSREGLNTNPFTGIYPASKHAAEAIAERMSLELQAFGIEVATVNPGRSSLASIFKASRPGRAEETIRLSGCSITRSSPSRVPNSIRNWFMPTENFCDCSRHAS